MSLRLFHLVRSHFECFAQFQWEPRDLWIGAFWRMKRYTPKAVYGKDKSGTFSWVWTLHIYVCILPMIPLHISIMRKVPL